MQKRSPIAVILLSIITCWLYALYLIYNMSEEIRPYAEEEMMAPGLELLLCIVCFPYIIFWVYKYSKALYYMQNQAGIQYPSDNTVLNVVLTVLGFPVIAMAIMQSDINRVADFKNSSY